MNALLIYPRFPDTFWSFKHSVRVIRKKANSPPLGLLTVASMLPAEWKLLLIDMNISELSDEDLAWADYAMISAMVAQRDSAREIIARCKQSGVTVIAGGPLFSSEHDDFGDVDHFVLGEAAVTLPSFLKDIARGRARRVYRCSNWADLNKTPSPRWDLVHPRQCASGNIQYSPGALTIVTSAA
jgi:radical SAM superfamily enzyme YgiQ (UPF0313 family)